MSESAQHFELVVSALLCPGPGRRQLCCQRPTESSDLSTHYTPLVSQFSGDALDFLHVDSAEDAPAGANDFPMLFPS